MASGGGIARQRGTYGRTSAGTKRHEKRRRRHERGLLAGRAAAGAGMGIWAKWGGEDSDGVGRARPGCLRSHQAAGPPCRAHLGVSPSRSRAGAGRRRRRKVMLMCRLRTGRIACSTWFPAGLPAAGRRRRLSSAGRGSPSVRAVCTRCLVTCRAENRQIAAALSGSRQTRAARLVRGRSLDSANSAQSNACPRIARPTGRCR